MFDLPGHLSACVTPMAYLEQKYGIVIVPFFDPKYINTFISIICIH